MNELHPARRGREAGETLIELIVTIAIMAVTIPAVIGAVLLAVDSSSQDRRMVQAQRLITSWSETIAANATTNASYSSCPSLAYYATGSFAPSPAPPAGFTATVAGPIGYWKPAAGDFTNPCTTDVGVRQIHLQIKVVAGLYPAFTLDRYVVVRKPCANSDTQC